VLLAGAVLLAVLLAGESSRTMLASASLSCYVCKTSFYIIRITEYKVKDK